MDCNKCTIDFTGNCIFPEDCKYLKECTIYCNCGDTIVMKARAWDVEAKPFFVQCERCKADIMLEVVDKFTVRKYRESSINKLEIGDILLCENHPGEKNPYKYIVLSYHSKDKFWKLLEFMMDKDMTMHFGTSSIQEFYYDEIEKWGMKKIGHI